MCIKNIPSERIYLCVFIPEERIMLERKTTKLYDRREVGLCSSYPEILSKEWLRNSDLTFNKKRWKNSWRRKKIIPFLNRNLFSKKKLLKRSSSSMTFFLRKSSVYVLKRIGNAETKTRKAFWTLVLIIGLVGCVSQTAQFFASYINYPVVINRVLVDAKKQQFPSVTVCNINNIKREFLRCLEGHKNYTECFPERMKANTALRQTIEESTCDSNELNKHYDEKSNWLYFILSQDYESQVKYGHGQTDFIRSCTFNNKKCKTDDFELYRSFYYGNCYTFKSRNGTRNAKKAGPRSGLELELDLEVDKYAPFTEGVGARVQVHGPLEKQDVNQKGVNISPGYTTYISLTKYSLERLPSPYKDRCKAYEPGVNQKVCTDRCFENITASLCGCSLGLVRQEVIPHCDVMNPVVLCCLLKSVKIRTDSCKCPLSCEDTMYRLLLSSTVWPSKLYYTTNRASFGNSAKNSSVLAYEDVRRTRLKVKIFFDKLGYTAYIQSPCYQSSEVLSQIGGQMGLWLGSSLMIVFESIQHLIIFCKRKKETRIKKIDVERNNR